MKKYSVLICLVFTVFLSGFVQNMPYAHAAQGDIGAIVESLNFDGTLGITPDIVQVSGDTFAVVYEGPNDDGFLKTFRVDSTGDILTNAVIAISTFSSGDVTNPKILHVTGDRYLIVYGDGSNIHAAVYQISSDGSTLTIKTAGSSVISTGSDPDIVRLSGASGATQFYAIAYTGSGAGMVDTISVTTGDLITNLTGSAISYATNSADVEILKVSGTTYAVAFRDNTNFGHVETLTIPDDGDLSSATVDVGNLADNLNGGTTISSTSNLDFVHVTGTIYAVAWSDGTNGKIQTITINSAGTALAVSGAGTGASFATTAVVDPVLIQTDITSSPFAFLVAYYDSTNTDGVIKSFTITNGGVVSSVIDTLNYNGANGKFPIIAHRTGDFYVVGYQGTSLAGSVSSFNLGDPDTTPPVVTNVGLTSNNANTALAKSGNTVTVTIEDNEQLKITTATIGGKTATIGTNDANTVTATRVLDGTETEGTLDFSVRVEDTAGNGLVITAIKGTGANVVSDFTAPSVTSVSIASNGNSGWAKNTDVVTVTVADDETLTVTAQTIDGKVATVGTNNANTVTMTRTMDGTETVGTLTFSITVSDAAGNTTTLTSKTTGTDIIADFTAPTLTSATITGTKSLNLLYSEPVLSTNTAHYTVLWADPTANVVAAVAGSGTNTILVQVTDASATTDDADLSITNGVTDRAGNPLTAIDNQKITDDFVQPTLSGSNNQVTLSDDTSITTITATSVAPNVNLSGLTGGANTATFPASAITVDASNADVLFPAGVVASNLPSDEVIEISVSTKTASAAVLPAGEAAGTIIELGDPDTTITFDVPVKVTLTGQAGKTPFIVTSTPTTILVNDCTTGSATVAPTLTSTDPTNTASHCAIDAGADLIIWTRHFTGFGTSSVPAKTTTTVSSGGSGGDTTRPSISTNFDVNEYPLEYAGVRYHFYDLDSIHTAILKTGEHLEATLRLYENSGVGNIQHVEMYVNQFGSRVLNDLTETVVIYDKQSGLEIIDPHNLIETADIVPSESGNKAVFDFKIIFEDEILESGVLFRVWDVKRNSMDLYLPKALIVHLSDQPSGIVSSEPSSDLPNTIEPTAVIEAGSVIEDGTVIAAGTVIKSGVTIEKGVILETGVTIEQGVVTDTGISLDSGTTTEPGLITDTEIVVIKSLSDVLDSPDNGIIINNWSLGQLSVLKQWSGYDTKSASDAEVLSKFGIKGEQIPRFVKDLTPWIVKDQISQKEFVNLLQYLKKEGMLSKNTKTKPFPANTQNEPENFIATSPSNDKKLKFESDENKLDAKSSFNDLEDKLRILRALVNNEIIQNELLKSNAEFDALDDPDYLINQRDSEWLRSPTTVTAFMESLMSNEPSLVAKAIIDHDADSPLPITEIVITNSYGVNIAITEKTQDYKQSDEQWWSKTKADGSYMISGSSSEEYSGLSTTEISVSINDRKGNFIGIIKAVVNSEKAFLLN